MSKFTPIVQGLCKKSNPEITNSIFKKVRRYSMMEIRTFIEDESMYRLLPGDLSQDSMDQIGDFDWSIICVPVYALEEMIIEEQIVIRMNNMIGFSKNPEISMILHKTVGELRARLTSICRSAEEYYVLYYRHDNLQNVFLTTRNSTEQWEEDIQNACN